MKRPGLFFALVSVVLAASGVVALGQLEPPTGGGGNVLPPTSGAAPSTAPGIVVPASVNDARDVARGNQAIVTNAFLGSVNAEPVFVQDVFRPIDVDLRRAAKDAKSLGGFEMAAKPMIESQLSTYCSRLLMYTAAKGELSSDALKQVDAYIDRERRKLITDYEGSKERADAALAESGSSVEKEMAGLRREAVVQLYLSKLLAPKIVITREMVEDEYARTPQKWDQPESLELYTLSLPVARWLRKPTGDGTLGAVPANPTAAQVKDAEAQAMATADEVVAKLKKGADFAQLVEDYNSHDMQFTYGGRMANVTRGSLVEELESYVFSLPANSIGKPLLLLDPDINKCKVVVVKVGQKTAAHTVPFTEAQGKIYADLKEQQRRTLTDAYFRKLEEEHPIEGESRMLDTAVQCAVATYFTR